MNQLIKICRDSTYIYCGTFYSVILIQQHEAFTHNTAMPILLEITAESNLMTTKLLYFSVVNINISS